MAIPDYQSIMLPLLRLADDGNDHSLREAIEGLSNELELTEAERSELLPSGQQPKFDNRVHWARSYLTKAGLLEAPRRGHFRITDRGREVLSQKPVRIDVRFLDQFPEFVEFRSKHREREQGGDTSEGETLQTPGEMLESAYQRLREDLSAELLKSVKECTPSFFERLVIDVDLQHLCVGHGDDRLTGGGEAESGSAWLIGQVSWKPLTKVPWAWASRPFSGLPRMPR